MTTITSPWPFAQLGIDVMGPLPQGKKQVKFLLVAIDYFTKGWKKKHCRWLRKPKFRILYGRISSTSLSFSGRSSQTTVVNLTAKALSLFSWTSKSRTNSLHQDTLKPTDRKKWQIKHCWRSSKLNWREQKAHDPPNYQMSYGPTEPQLEPQQEKHHSTSSTVPKH